MMNIVGQKYFSKLGKRLQSLSPVKRNQAIPSLSPSRGERLEQLSACATSHMGEYISRDEYNVLRDPSRTSQLNSSSAGETSSNQ